MAGPAPPAVARRTPGGSTGRPGSVVGEGPVPGPGAIALPDRPGNRRGGGYHDVPDSPYTGLPYLIPGSKQVLRVDGRAASSPTRPSSAR